VARACKSSWRAWGLRPAAETRHLTDRDRLAEMGDPEETPEGTSPLYPKRRPATSQKADRPRRAALAARQVKARITGEGCPCRRVVGARCSNRRRRRAWGIGVVQSEKASSQSERTPERNARPARSFTSVIVHKDLTQGGGGMPRIGTSLGLTAILFHAPHGSPYLVYAWSRSFSYTLAADNIYGPSLLMHRCAYLCLKITKCLSLMACGGGLGPDSGPRGPV
jgi:hypothetical protein